MQDLHYHVPYLTFYPAVTIAALFGGLESGLLATLLSGVVIYFWQSADHPFLTDLTDWESMSIFIITGILVSGMSGLMIYARARERIASERHMRERQQEAHVRESQRSQKQIQEGEERLQLFIEYAPVALAMFDQDMRYLAASRRWMKDYSLGERDIIGLSHYEIFPEIPDRWKALHRRGLAGEVVLCEDDPFEREDGTVQWLRWEIRPWHIGAENQDAGKVGGIVIFTEDITERKRESDQLRLWAGLFDQADLGLAFANATTNKFISVNPAFAKQHGYSREEMVGRPVATVFPADLQGEMKDIIASLETQPHLVIETEHVTRDGRRFPIFMDITSIRTKDGRPDKRIVYTLDISERKQLEKELKDREARYRAVLETTTEGFWIIGPGGRLIEVNDAYATLSGYSRGELLTMTISDLEAMESPQETAARIEKIMQTGHDRFETVHRRKDGSTWPVEVAVNYVKSFNDLYFAFLIDISERKRTEEKIAEYVKQLEVSMEGTLQAVSNMVEHRDPYTAGHERRVGIIAADIAREMGWPEEKCKDLELIGLVHDIGKIGVPAEILTKPGRLSKVEYQLVQGHVEIGHEILKDVKFRLPIAEIIYQHHERMDGSGYPRGLKGDQILIEARILAVSDVLESMAAYRPYRPALGIDAAIKEITDHRGTGFDDSVVEALLRLFNEKDYRIPT